MGQRVRTDNFVILLQTYKEVNSKYKSDRQLDQGKLQNIMNKPVMLSIQYLYIPMRLGSLEFSLTKVGSRMYFVKALAKNSG